LYRWRGRSIRRDPWITGFGKKAHLKSLETLTNVIARKAGINESQRGKKGADVLGQKNWFNRETNARGKRGPPEKELAYRRKRKKGATE